MSASDRPVAPVLLGGSPLSCADLHAVCHGAPVALDEAARERMAANAAAVPSGPSVLQAKRRWLMGGTGEDLDEHDLAREFILSHCAGVGPPLPVPFVRGAMVARAAVLAQGLSGCRPEAAEVLVAMLNAGAHPEVPAQGSVGAAGDLAPMAHIARVACGWAGPQPGVSPFLPTGKEALALINGVSLTAALAAVAVVRARRVLDAAVAACAMTMETVGADFGCIDPRPHAARRHPGPSLVASRLRGLLAGSQMVTHLRNPDAFSIRCAPGVLGAALEALEHVERIVERELDGVSDNPLLFVEPSAEGAEGEGTPRWIEAGNIHGAHLALAMDHLKTAMVQVATLSERRTYRLSYGQLTPGLPSFLVPGTGLNSGFMLAQYTAASLASECKTLAHPASVDTIPTTQHHEDHNSMGPIAARTTLEVLECVADVVGIEALLAAQGLDLRQQGRAWTAEGEPVQVEPVALCPAVGDLWAAVREVVPFWEDDGVLHPCLEAVGKLVRAGLLSRPDGDRAAW